MLGTLASRKGLGKTAENRKSHSRFFEHRVILGYGEPCYMYKVFEIHELTRFRASRKRKQRAEGRRKMSSRLRNRWGWSPRE